MRNLPTILILARDMHKRKQLLSHNGQYLPGREGKDQQLHPQTINAS